MQYKTFGEEGSGTLTSKQICLKKIAQVLNWRKTLLKGYNFMVKAKHGSQIAHHRLQNLHETPSG